MAPPTTTPTPPGTDPTAPSATHLFGGHGNDRTRAHRHRRARHMRLEVVVGGVERLPDPVQVRLAIGCTGGSGAREPAPRLEWPHKMRLPPPLRQRAQPKHLETYCRASVDSISGRRDCCSSHRGCQGRSTPALEQLSPCPNSGRDSRRPGNPSRARGQAVNGVNRLDVCSWSDHQSVQRHRPH